MTAQHQEHNQQQPTAPHFRTSQEWWSELKLSPERQIDWLKKQYHGELLASERVAQLSDDCRGTRWHQTLETIAQQEAKHAGWVGELLHARGIEPERLEKNERYWNVVLAEVNTFEGLAAAAAHAEAMRLERIKVIYNDPDTEDDIRAVFGKILHEEEFHVKAFTRMAGDEALAAALAKHEEGMAAINVSMESALIPFAD